MTVWAPFFLRRRLGEHVTREEMTRGGGRTATSILSFGRDGGGGHA